jgi:hypothetical protein
MFWRKLAKAPRAIEIALGLSFLVVWLVVIADVARASYVKRSVASAARAAVRYGAQSYVKAIDNAGMIRAADNDVQYISGLSVIPRHFCTCDGAQCSPPSSSACFVSCTAPPSTCTEPKVFVEVTTRATFNTLIKYPDAPNSIPLSSTAMLLVQKAASQSQTAGIANPSNVPAQATITRPEKW